jgi:hypothetical protein
MKVIIMIMISFCSFGQIENEIDKLKDLCETEFRQIPTKFNPYTWSDGSEDDIYIFDSFLNETSYYITTDGNDIVPSYIEVFNKKRHKEVLSYIESIADYTFTVDDMKYYEIGGYICEVDTDKKSESIIVTLIKTE